MAQTQQSSDLIGQRQVRIDKVNRLKELGIDPYPAKSNRNQTNKEVLDNFTNYEEKEVTLAGRLMTWRSHGALTFADVQDPTGRIQFYIREDTLTQTDPESGNIGYNDLNMFDIGDIIEGTGTIVKTERGEISLQVTSLRMLTKALRPLPEKHAGLKDRETIFRQRYLETTMDPDAKWRFEKGAQIVFAIREFLNNRGFLEIKTPILQPIYGGGNAKPFITKVNALNTNYYMAIAHELYLKRLITAGFENVYNIAGYFRNEGIDRSHNPEFQMLETMTSYQNYEFNMDLIEEMYKYVAEKVFGRTVFKVREQDIDFGKPWERITMVDAVKKHTGHDFGTTKELSDAHAALTQLGYSEEMPESIGESMVAAFELAVEDKLIQPTFITGHPVEISPLAKRRRDDPRYVERFEIFIGGIEGGDNWSELNDPLELYERFKDQVERGSRGLEEFHPMDVEFIETMEYGMPPTTGLGPGIERLIMMYTETEYIDDVIFFPMLKPAPPTETQKEIYGAEYLVGSKGTDSGEQKQDTSRKMVVVLNQDLAGWQLTNTVGHISAYLGNKIGEKFDSVEAFETADGVQLPPNSQYGIVTKKAKSSQLQKLHEEVRSSGLAYICFTQDMIDSGNDAELMKMYKKQDVAELKILGIGVFGLNEALDALVGKFSLWG